MKLFKIIIICVVSVALVLSLALNVFLLCGFEIVKKADSPEPTPAESGTDAPEEKEPDKKPKPHKDRPLHPTVSKDDGEKPCDNSCGVLIYRDDNIKVTYLSSCEEASGPVHTMRLENTSSKTLTVLFSEVYINDREVFASGLTCEHLLSDTETDAGLYLVKTDWEHFTDSPDKVSFKIKLQNDKSRLDLYETDRITLTF